VAFNKVLAALYTGSNFKLSKPLKKILNKNRTYDNFLYLPVLDHIKGEALFLYRLGVFTSQNTGFLEEGCVIF
jgi:hypothetical protein